MGELLFATHQDTEHLHLIRKIVNAAQYPAHMMNHHTAEVLRWPTSNGALSSPSLKSIKYIEKCKSLPQLIRNDPLLDLIQKCLCIDPAERIMASQGKAHPFFHQFKNRNAENQEFMKIYDLINKTP